MIHPPFERKYTRLRTICQEKYRKLTLFLSWLPSNDFIRRTSGLSSDRSGLTLVCSGPLISATAPQKTPRGDCCTSCSYLFFEQGAGTGFQRKDGLTLCRKHDISRAADTLVTLPGPFGRRNLRRNRFV